MNASAWLPSTLPGFVWTSVSRGLLGFLLALAIGTLLGLAVSRMRFVRETVGPVLSALRSLPSVLWVPAVVLWLGLSDPVMYGVILLGAVPAIAAGVGSSPPAYLAGLKKGWAFTWRALLAAQLIASAPGLDRFRGSDHVASSVPLILLATLLVLTVGIAVDLLILSPLERRVLRPRTPRQELSER